jgi:hypothetical protein
MIYVLNPIPPNRNQKPNLCAATCLQMILERRGINYDRNLENLASTLGLHIDERDKDMFGEKLRKTALPSGDARIGLIIDDFKKKEKPEIIKANFGLESKVYIPSEFKDKKGVKNFLIESLNTGDDLMLNYRLEPFNGRSDGHYVLVFGFNEDNNDVYVSDPSPFTPEYWTAKLEKFLFAMKPIWKEDDGQPRERAFVRFSGPNNGDRDDSSNIDKIIKSIKEYIPIDTRIKRKTPSPVSYRPQKTA